MIGSSTKSKNTALGVVCAGIVVTMLVFIYQWAKNEKARRDHSVGQVVKLLMQREAGFFDSYATTTKIEDLERFGLTTCTYFARVTNPPITLLDLREKKQCQNELLVHKPNELTVKSRSGEAWVFHYVPATGKDFVLQWGLASFACLAIAGLLLIIWRIGQSSIQLVLENRRKLHQQISHDSKSPLLALKELARGQEKFEPRVVKVLYQCIENLEGMILSLNEDQAQSGSSQKIATLLEQVIEEKRAECPEKKSSIRATQNSQRLAKVDPIGFKRLVSNAINNSWESGAEVEIELSLEDAEAEIVLTIRDNGQGISQEVLRYFKRERISTKGKGRGFGLSGALEFCDNHGGRYEIRALSPKGTEVQIRLPAIEGELPQRDLVNRIILIDDDNLVAAIWKAKAQELRIGFVRFASYQEFSEGDLKALPDDAVFVDYELGDDKGTRVIPLLQQRGWNQIWLATAHDKAQIGPVPGVRGILSKEFPV